MDEITASDPVNNLIEELWNCSNNNSQDNQLPQKIMQKFNYTVNENNNSSEENTNLNSLHQNLNLKNFFKNISQNKFKNINLKLLYSNCSNKNLITLSFLILKHYTKYFFHDKVIFPTDSKKINLIVETLNKFAEIFHEEICAEYMSFKENYLTYILIFIKEKLHEDKFLKNIGLDTKQINENRNYDTKQMRAKIQKSFYLIKDPILLYIIADYLCNYIFFTDEQVEYIENKFKDCNGYNSNLNYLKKIGYDDIEPNYFQVGLCFFFNPVTQALLSLSSLSIMATVLLNLTLGPIGLGLTIGICSLLTLTSLTFAIRDFKILFSKNKNGEIISDIMMDYFKESNRKKLLAKNKIGKPPQNTQATVEQEEEFTNNDEPATLQIPEASAMPPSEPYDNQQEQSQ